MRTTKQVTAKKANGIHFTPPELACFVAQKIIRYAPLSTLSSIKVLDPACGDGELLLALAKTLPAHLRDKTTLIGIETDSQALEKARERLKSIPVKQVTLENSDFLEMCKNHPLQPSLFHDMLVHTLPPDPVDIIIANPPYVRTQILGSIKAQDLAHSFDLSGRVDLYHAFLVAMTRRLVPGGIIGVITSNRFLSTRGGASIRAFMAREYDIVEVIDLGDTKLFEAAVLPAIFIGRKRALCGMDRLPAQQEASFIRIYETIKGSTSLATESKPSHSVYTALEDGSSGDYSIAGQHFKIATGTLSLPSATDQPWSMVTSDERSWLKTVHTHTPLRVSDVAKVRVGVKTTADEVFIRADWNELPEAIQPEKPLLRQLLSQDNANRWVPKTEGIAHRQVLYPHRMRDGKREAIDLKQYPKAAAYLEQNRHRLSSRTYVLEAKRNWYEIWVPQNPALWSQPKLVFPDISPAPKFFYDGQGYIVDGNCYWIIPHANQPSDLLFLIAGLANSHFMTRYHDLAFNNKLYAGRRRYLTQYVEKYPLPDPTTPMCSAIISLVKELIFDQLSDQVQKYKERALEILIGQAFGVEPIVDA